MTDTHSSSLQDIAATLTDTPIIGEAHTLDTKITFSGPVEAMEAMRLAYLNAVGVSPDFSNRGETATLSLGAGLVKKYFPETEITRITGPGIGGTQMVARDLSIRSGIIY